MVVNKQEVRVGLFVLIPFVIMLLFILLKLGFSIKGSTIDVYLKLDGIKAIKNGTLVKVKGYTVGRVVDIIPVYEPDLHFLALMRIQNEIKLFEDCAAVVANQNVIGDAIIELKNPSRSGNPLRNGDVLEGIAYVNVEALLNDVHSLLATITDTVLVFQDISVESKGNIRRLLNNLSDSVETVNNTLRDSQKDILETMKAFRNTAQTMQDISRELEKSPVKFLMKDEKKE
ncbi:MAG: MCE family protein [Spirochaetes bacterium]|nr:MCE family protein [Spirochaetota bacterium]